MQEIGVQSVNLGGCHLAVPRLEPQDRAGVVIVHLAGDASHMLQQDASGACPPTSHEPGTTPPTASPDHPATPTVQPSERPTSRVPTRTAYRTNRAFCQGLYCGVTIVTTTVRHGAAKTCQSYGHSAPHGRTSWPELQRPDLRLLGHTGQTRPAGLCPDSETTAWTPQPHIQRPASWP